MVGYNNHDDSWFHVDVQVHLLDVGGWPVVGQHEDLGGAHRHPQAGSHPEIPLFSEKGVQFRATFWLNKASLYYSIDKTRIMRLDYHFYL
jgi:hypothetical protein